MKRVANKELIVDIGTKHREFSPKQLETLTTSALFTQASDIPVWRKRLHTEIVQFWTNVKAPAFFAMRVTTDEDEDAAAGLTHSKLTGTLQRTTNMDQARSLHVLRITSVAEA